MRDLEPGNLTDTVPMEGDMLPSEAWTFEMVQDRLVEAMITCWRDVDRERGWLRLRAMWPEISRTDPGDHDARGALEAGEQAAIRPASLTRLDVEEMTEAFRWVERLDPVDRRIVALAVAQLARGQRQVRWSRMLALVGMTRGADGLRVRYGRAIASIAAALNFKNGRKASILPCSPIA